MRGVFFFLCALALSPPVQASMTEYPKVRLRSIDKITARTMTFDAAVGSTLKFGSIFIKILACQKPDIQERPEAASFLQIWEITAMDESKWIFSGWMFASSPALSAMDHPIYDVWVMDCLDDGTVAKKKAEEKAKKEAAEKATAIETEDTTPPIVAPAAPPEGETPPATAEPAPETTTPTAVEPSAIDQVISNTIEGEQPVSPPVPTVPVE